MVMAGWAQRAYGTPAKNPVNSESSPLSFVNLAGLSPNIKIDQGY